MATCADGRYCRGFGFGIGQKGLGSLLGANAQLLGHLWRLRCGAHSVGLDLCGLGGGVAGCRDHSQPARNWSSIEAHRRWSRLVVSLGFGNFESAGSRQKNVTTRPAIERDGGGFAH